MLEKLKKSNKKIVIATSKPEVYAKRIAEKFKIIKYFDYIAGAELNGDRTNKSEVIEYALKKISISNKNDAIMVGDREYDIIGAKLCRLDCVGVLYGYGSYDELFNAGATYIVKDIKELSNLLT